MPWSKAPVRSRAAGSITGCGCPAATSWPISRSASTGWSPKWNGGARSWTTRAPISSARCRSAPSSSSSATGPCARWTRPGAGCSPTSAMRSGRRSTVIRGEAEVTLRAQHGTTDDYRATLARIVETAAQLNKLVEDLLEVARSESAAVPLETSDVAATELIRDVGEDANALAATKGIRVSCGVPRQRDPHPRRRRPAAPAAADPPRQRVPLHARRRRDRDHAWRRRSRTRW